MSCELRVILLIFQGCNTEQLKDLKASCNSDNTNQSTDVSGRKLILFSACMVYWKHVVISCNVSLAIVSYLH